MNRRAPGARTRRTRGGTRRPVVAFGVLALVAATVVPAAALDRVWLASFDEAWRIVRDTYYDPSFNGLDWDAVRRELRPRAEAAVTANESRAILREMIGRLGDSHFALLPNGTTPDPGARTGSGDPGLEFRYQAGELLVVGVSPDGGAAAAGIRPGWLLEAVDGDPLEPLVRRTVASAGPALAALEVWRVVTDRLRGPVASRAALQTRDSRGASRQVSVERRAESGEPVTLGTFPTLHVRTETRTLQAPAGGHVGYIRFNAWLPPIDAFVARAVDAHRDAAGIVLDLRGNPGGLAAMLMGIAGQFVADRVSLGEMRTREGTLRFFANPRLVGPDGHAVTPFRGRVAILVDGLSGSASECFAGGMQAIGRARVFGERSMGQALPALFARLPSGDVLVHAYADFVTADGRRLEGAGVQPDTPAPWSRESLVQGRDVALERAVEWAGWGEVAGACRTCRLPAPDGLW
jgi:carboxyl-terminal processing protease